MNQKEGEIGWAVRAHGDGDRIEHEQKFYLKDFPDANARALRHAERIRRLMPECEVYVPVIWGPLPA